MAKLTGHGAEVGTIQYLTTAKRYFADGTILKNRGFGWREYGRVKEGITPQQAFNNACERLRLRDIELPAFAAYRKALHKVAGVSKRWKIHQCIDLLPGDPDGVWSEACDGYGDNVHADIDEVVELCRLYDAALREQRAAKKAA
jgi:hypothetical protein